MTTKPDTSPPEKGGGMPESVKITRTGDELEINSVLRLVAMLPGRDFAVAGYVRQDIHDSALAAERAEVTRLATLAEEKIVALIRLQARWAAVRAGVVALGDAANGESFGAQNDGPSAAARDWAVRGGVYRKVLALLDA